MNLFHSLCCYMVAPILVAIEEVGPQVVSAIIVHIEEVDCSWFMSYIVE